MKMQINKNNYEAFFLDYHEGRLSPSEKEAVDRFIKENPGYYEEFKNFENITLDTPDMQYPFKDTLKKPNVLDQQETTFFEEKCIARFEGNLSPEETSEFDEELKNDTHKKLVYDTVTKTKLTPDTTIQCPDKSSLKKTPVISMLSDNAKFIGIAASIVLLVVLGSLYYTGIINESPDRYSVEYAHIDTELKNPFKPEQIKVSRTEFRENEFSGNLSLPENSDANEKTDPDALNDTEEVVSASPTISRQTVTLPEAELPEKVHLSPIRSLQDIPGEKMYYADKKDSDTDPEYEAFINRKLKQSPVDETAEEFKKKGLWVVAEFSVKGISKLTGANIALENTYKEDGGLKEFAFITRNYEIKAKKEKN